MIENLKNHKDHSNEAINSETEFDTSSFNLSSGTSDPLPVLNVSLRGGKKHRVTTASGIKCLWESEDTDRMIKRQHTKHYELRIWYNKVDYSTAAGVYCTIYDVKLPVCIPELSSSNIINHRFHVDNDKGESGICYDMIIGRDLMVQLGLTA